jgi:hypothetical protein
MPSTTLFRIFKSYSLDSSPRSPWNFSSVNAERSNRFDLPEPNGSCYFASTEYGAWLETIRGPRVVTRQQVENLSIARVSRKTTSIPLADLTSAKSTSYGVTLDVATGDDYSQTQEIAHLLWNARFKGVRTFLRRSPSARVYTFGIFGSVGVQLANRGWKATSSNLIDETQLLRLAVADGFKVVDIPADMRITQPRIAQFEPKRR